ncbi:MAG: hypothetical protein JNK29_09945 [Anaerolineales bacterium]|nr:hypothetical protein [Anaerolineales bacterium]
MSRLWSWIVSLGGLYLGAAAALWGITEAYTYFTGQQLRDWLGDYWLLVFYGGPLLFAVAVQLRRRPVELSSADLAALTRAAVDLNPQGAIRRPYHNVELSDQELRQRIAERNRQRLPTYLLREEYRRRLGQRERQ